MVNIQINVTTVPGAASKSKVNSALHPSGVAKSTLCLKKFPPLNSL